MTETVKQTSKKKHFVRIGAALVVLTLLMEKEKPNEKPKKREKLK
jgi:hypothetical protein